MLAVSERIIHSNAYGPSYQPHKALSLWVYSYFVQLLANGQLIYCNVFCY
ncbi:hypothetical protein B7P43_G10482 [Cryptotermes secundus]|uniref:Uncharacterized protein n=1 Tax=Cryptotermes secundus TaxID=105785 RepID=A0A2J7QKZ2_9NEOP|nr:hypothetical protein B7P43_G10482 [Cryptotermes secundus]